MSAGVMVERSTRRHDEWRDFGASAAESDELVVYEGDSCDHDVQLGGLAITDQPFVATWAGYVQEAESIGAARCLRSHLPQLRFPIRAGMSSAASYRAATRRGESDRAPNEGGDCEFASPEGIRVFLHPTAAGRVPVILADNRRDFETLVRALTYHNEPVAIPASMGACIVGGYNNWDRVAELRASWAATSADGSTEAWWRAFRAKAPSRERYQDRFILLSSGPYSGVPADSVGIVPEAWHPLSVVIRLEHECTHFITRCLLGSMRNCLLDELIADYAGIVAACGNFRYDWFLHFMGLECFPRCRPNGRVWNYRGTPPLSDGALGVLQRTVVEAARRLEEFDHAHGEAWRSVTGRAQLAIALARTGLARLARAEGVDVLTAMLSDVSR
ncbi:MAG: DUF7005 family protein [Gemmatimonadaceae bacterium]